MIHIAIGAMVALVAQSAPDRLRVAFVTCLGETVTSAKAAKVAPEQFDAYLRAACTPAATKLKNSAVAFDVKNGVSRKQATSDANLDIEDYFATKAERYKADVPSAPK